MLVPGTEGGTEVFVTPAGDWLVFATMQPSIIKRMPIAGGPVTEVARPRSNVRGIGVLPDGDLVFGEHSLGMFRAPRTGEPLVSIADVTSEGPPRYPVPLPGNRGLLYTVGGIPSANHISVLAAGATTPRRLTAGTFARYLSTGHLVFWRDGSLWIAPFDAHAPRAHGRCRSRPSMASACTGNGYAHFAVAENGTLAYIPAG